MPRLDGLSPQQIMAKTKEVSPMLQNHGLARVCRSAPLGR